MGLRLKGTYSTVSTRHINMFYMCRE